MNSNRNGFTLIEMIVSLALLAIASSMFILGFFNITNLMTESAIIKNNTNEIYNSVLSNPEDIVNDVIENQNISLKVNGTDNVLINGKTFKKEKNGSDLNIRLSRFIPSLVADELPTQIEDVEEVDPNTCLTAQFKVITNLAELPESYEALKKLEQDGTGIFKFDSYATVKTITKSINPKVNSLVFGGHAGKYIVSEPIYEDLSYTLKNNRYFNDQYSIWLSNNYYARWICIEPSTDLSRPYTVYGYLLKKDSRDLVINLNDDQKDVSCYYSLTDDVLSRKKLDIKPQDKIQLLGKKFVVNDDTTIYSYEDLVNLKFIKDNSKSIYIAKVVI